MQNGSVIGAEGFGFAYTPEGRRVRVPHRGSVVVGDDVQIGSNTTIDASHPGHPRRGRAGSSTLIGRGEVVTVGERFGVKLLELVSPEKRG